MRTFNDTVSVSSSIGPLCYKDCHGQSGNYIKGVVTRKEEPIVLPSGRTLFKRRKSGENTMLIGVTQEIAHFLVGSGRKITIKTLDGVLHTGLTSQTSVTKEQLIYCGVALSNGGAEGNVVHAVDRYGKGFDESSLIPWRVVNTSGEQQADLYRDYGCRVVSGSNAKYYIKKLKSVTFVNRTIDGETTLEDNPDVQLSGHEAVETVIKTGFTVELEDLAEHYRTLGDVNARKFSKISLFIGKTVNVTGGYQDYRNLICANQLNIEEEYLKQNKKAEYEYLIHIR